jgi:Tfp pilus assembly protein PilV
MQMQKPYHRQTGIGLVEVLVAAAVFSIGVMAIIKLQGELTRGGSEANARSIATQLAQEKLDDLRRFGSSAAGGFAFTAIANNAGGYIAADASTSNATTTEGGVDYARTWTVDNYYFTGTPLSQTPVTPVPAGSTVAQKRVTVTVSWVDQTGTTQQVQLSDIINANTPAMSAGLMGGANANGPGADTPGPKVQYTPDTSPGTVGIGVGDTEGTVRETLVPSASVGQSTFKAYTYAPASAGSSTMVLVREEEFENVRCDCRFNGTATANTAAHPQWDSDADTYVDKEGQSLSKTVGCVQGGGSNCSANPEPFCDSCCKNHHDTNASGVVYKYDPYRGAGDFNANGDGDHNHYNSNGNLVTPASGAYVEACRFKRINGQWQVYQDWHLVSHSAFPQSLLDNGGTESTYEDYVKALIDEHLVESKVAGETLSSPPSKPANFVINAANPLVILNSNDQPQLSGRAVYLDYMDATHLAGVLAKKNAIPQQSYLVDVPFYELDATNLTDWSSANTSQVTVGPLTVHGGGGYTIIAGQVHGVASTSGATVNISSAFKRSNSGVTHSDSPDGVDFNTAVANYDSSKLTDNVAVCVNAGCSATTTSATTTTTTAAATTTTAPSTTTTAATTTTTTAAPSTCTTTISGTAGNKNDTLTVIVNGADQSPNCSVANSKAYTCNSVTTATTATIAIHSQSSGGQGSVTATTTISPICGARTVNF